MAEKTACVMQMGVVSSYSWSEFFKIGMGIIGKVEFEAWSNVGYEEN